MINIGVIGYGYWGPNLVRNFAELEGATMAAVADLDAKKLEIVKRRHPATRVTTRFEDMLAEVLAYQSGLPRGVYDQKAVLASRALLARELCVRHRVLPAGKTEEGALTLLSATALSEESLGELGDGELGGMHHFEAKRDEVAGDVGGEEAEQRDEADHVDEAAYEGQGRRCADGAPHRL